jgi:LEA14-like dessication related protein
MFKKSRIGKALLVALSIVIILTVLYLVFNPKKAINLVFPGLNEVSYVHIDLKEDSSLVKLFMLVQNKMPYRMVIDTIHFKVQLNGSKVVEETIPVLIDQSRFDSDTIELPVHFSLKGFTRILADLQGMDSTDMDVNFWITYKTIIGNQKVHIDRTIRIATPVPPQITILKLAHQKYNMEDKTSEAVLNIEIINNGKNIDLQLSGISYNLQIINTLHSAGKVTRPIDIQPGTSQFVDIPIIIEYKKPFKTVWLVVTDNDTVTYDLNLKCYVRVNAIKDLKAIPVEIDATGTMELVK